MSNYDGTENPLGLRHTNAYYEAQKPKSLWESIKDDFMGCAVGESFVVPFTSNSKRMYIRNQLALRSKQFNKTFSTSTISPGKLLVTRTEAQMKDDKLWALIEDRFLNLAEGDSFTVELGNRHTENALRSLVSKRCNMHNVKYAVQNMGDNVFRLFRRPTIEENYVSHFPAWLAWRFDNQPKESYSALELAEAFEAGVKTGAAK